MKAAYTLTAQVMARVTANGTINPAIVPQTRTHYRQIGYVFYPNVSDMIATLAATWYADKPAPHGAECVGRAVLALMATPGPLGADLLVKLAMAEMWLAADADMQHVRGMLCALVPDAYLYAIARPIADMVRDTCAVPDAGMVQALAYVASETL